MSLSGTFRIGAPDFLAVLDGVGRKPSLNAKFAARYADIDFILHHHRRIGAGRAFGWVIRLHRPDDFSGFRIQRHQGGVGLMQEDLAIAVGDAAIYGVAAHDRDDVGILLRLILPKDLAVMIEIKREDRIGERRVHIHYVANDQRARPSCPRNTPVENVHATCSLPTLLALIWLSPE